MYDENNIFAKILKKEIPCSFIYEDDFGFAFHDIHPKAPIHALIIPKGKFKNFDDFVALATPDMIVGYHKTIEKVVELLNLQKDGYRLLINCGSNAGQEVPHLHAHILGGGFVGPMTCTHQ
jgi:histidine triad (HIT) family protein